MIQTDQLPHHTVEDSASIEHDGRTIIHEIDNYGAHRICIHEYTLKPYVNVKTWGDWTGYDFIAHHGNYAATTPYYAGSLPEIFVVVPLKWEHE